MSHALRRLVVSAAVVGVTAGGAAVPVVPAFANPPHKSNPSQTNDSSRNYVPPAPATTTSSTSTGTATPSGTTGTTSTGTTTAPASSTPTTSTTSSSSSTTGSPSPTASSAAASPTPSGSVLPVIALPSQSPGTDGASPAPGASAPADGSPAPTPTFALPPGFAATKVGVFDGPSAEPTPQGRLSGLLARTGGPGLLLGAVGLVAAAGGAILLLRRRG